MSFPRKEHAGIHYVFFKQSLFFSGEFMAACHLPSVWVLLVQCFFLLAVCQTDASWNMLGFAIRMGQSLGLHIDADQLGRPFSQCELRRRTWQSMFVLDRLLALQLGRPMAIHADDFVVSLPQSPAIYDDGMHELEASGPSYADYFVHVIQFSHIVESVIGGLYHPNQKEIPPARMLSSAFILDDRLARWRNSLPRHLRFDLSHTFERSSVFRRQVRSPFHTLSDVNNLSAQYACHQAPPPTCPHLPTFSLPSNSSQERHRSDDLIRTACFPDPNG